MGDDLVLPDDILMAMADALMENQPKPFNPVLKFNDSKIEFKLGGKPPREIFYRNTVTFLTKLPPPVPHKMCTVRYACTGALATIKCHSCAIYDPSGTAFYCSKCFGCCHPWYRVSHIYSTIERDESIEHTLKVAHRVAEALRYEREGGDILERLRGEKPKLETIGDDAELDKKLRICGRRVVALEEYIENVRKDIREDVIASERRKSLVGISSTRQYLIEDYLRDYSNSNPASPVDSPKKKLKDISRQSTQRSSINDFTALNSPNSNASSPIDKKASKKKKNQVLSSSKSELAIIPTSTAIVPVLQAEIDAPQVNNENEEINNLHSPTQPNKDKISANTSKINELQHQAAIKIQKCFRGHLGRKTISSIMTLRLVRVWNPVEGREFYYDRVTGESSWAPSKLLRKDDIEYLEYIQHQEETVVNKWICKSIMTRKRSGLTQQGNMIIKILQGFARCILARKKIIRVANVYHRRVYDEETASFYYANMKNGDTSWHKPSFYLTNEPPIFTQEEENRRSPRVNRVQTAPKEPKFHL